MKPIGSEITGLVSQTERASSSTGLQHGVTGSAPPHSGSEIAAREWLLARDLAETDRKLRASLTSLLDGKPTRLLVDREIQRFSAMMTPPTQDDADQWLAALQVATAGAKRSDNNAALALDLYSACLRRYPADIAKAACTQLALSVQWFPTLAEIEAKCIALSDNRRRMLVSLRRWEEPIEADYVSPPMSSFEAIAHD